MKRLKKPAAVKFMKSRYWFKDWHQFDYIHHEYDDIIVNLHLFHSYVPDELLNLIHQPWT